MTPCFASCFRRRRAAFLVPLCPCSHSSRPSLPLSLPPPTTPHFHRFPFVSPLDFARYREHLLEKLRAEFPARGGVLPFFKYVNHYDWLINENSRNVCVFIFGNISNKNNIIAFNWCEKFLLRFFSINLKRSNLYISSIKDIYASLNFISIFLFFIFSVKTVK